MLPTVKRFFFLLPLLIYGLCSFAQETSPYSRFGLGEVSRPAFIAAKGMGGLGAAYRDPLHINMVNPASYSSLALTTFEGGLNFVNKKLKDGTSNNNYSTGDAFLDYLALGFPVAKNAGASFGIVPYSRVNYSFSSARNDSILGDSRKIYNGNGRVYQLYGGGGYRLFGADTSKHALSLGFNVAYLFGRVERDDFQQFSDRTFYNSRINATNRISNMVLNIGAQHRIMFNQEYSMVIGAYSLFPVLSRSKEDITWDRYVVLSGGIETVDTVYQNNYLREDLKIPGEYGVGATLMKRNKFAVGGEFKYNLWSKTESISDDATLSDSWEVRIGTELRPRYSQSFVKRSAYRLGGFYNNGHITIGEQRIREYGMTFGFGLPKKMDQESLITKFIWELNFTLEAGSRGTLNNGLIRETFIVAYLGFTLNDKWFVKRKYD